MYQFKKINEDEYILISNDKQFPFKRTVDLAKTVQSIDLKTTIKLAEVLAERGETLENTKLRIERKSGSETIIDESNLRMIEKKLRDIAWSEVADEIYKKLFNKSVLEMIKELGIDNDVEMVKKFSSEFFGILVNGLDDNTPRNENT